MRIALITPWDIECGIALYAENIAAEWARAGHDVVVLAETVADDWLLRREAPGLRVVRCWSRDSEFRRLLETIKYLGPFDVVNIQHEMSYVSLPHLWRQLISGLQGMHLPVVVTYHTWPFNVHPVTEFREVDGVIVLNHHARDSMLERGWSEDKVFHVAHAALAPVSPPPERPAVGRIVTWGFLTSHKGYSSVMEALAPLFRRYPRMRLTILGSWVRHVKGHQEHYLERELRPEIANRGLSERVGVLTGFPHQRVLQDLIADHDISVLYYGVNNTGYAASGCLQTAFSAGRPVIASTARHFDLLPEYEPAVLRARDTNELRRHVMRLVEDEGFYSEMVDRVRAVAEARHQEHAAADYIDVFRRVIASVSRRESCAPVHAAGKLSVVIATYNRKDSLRQAIESSQGRGVEVVVVDDGSTDGTAEMVRQEYPWVRLISLPQRFGQSYARNVGIREAAGQYIKFLDDDDTHLPGWQAALLDAIEQGYDVIGVGCAAASRARGNIEVLTDRLMYTSQLCVKRAALLAVGGFDVTIQWQEEHELLKRLDDAAYKVERLPVVAVVKREVDLRGFNVARGAAQDVGAAEGAGSRY